MDGVGVVNGVVHWVVLWFMVGKIRLSVQGGGEVSRCRKGEEIWGGPSVL